MAGCAAYMHELAQRNRIQKKNQDRIKLQELNKNFNRKCNKIVYSSGHLKGHIWYYRITFKYHDIHQKESQPL